MNSGTGKAVHECGGVCFTYHSEDVGEDYVDDCPFVVDQKIPCTAPHDV